MNELTKRPATVSIPPTPDWFSSDADDTAGVQFQRRFERRFGVEHLVEGADGPEVQFSAQFDCLVRTAVVSRDLNREDALDQVQKYLELAALHFAQAVNDDHPATTKEKRSDVKITLELTDAA